jgi:RNA polymerase sigma-70 factor (sigma-E family)
VAGPSFDEYAKARGAALVRYAYLLTADWALAEDLAQEALVSAHLRWRRIQKMDHPEAYVRKVVMTQFLSWRRKRSNTECPGGMLDDRSEVIVFDPAETAAERDVMWQRLAVLPRQQRAVLVLRYYEDLRDDQIAYLLGCAPSTVRVHASRGLDALRPHVPAATGSVQPGRP